MCVCVAVVGGGNVGMVVGRGVDAKIVAVLKCPT